jgi:hypothetical protein
MAVALLIVDRRRFIGSSNSKFKISERGTVAIIFYVEPFVPYTDLIYSIFLQEARRNAMDKQFSQA